MKRTLGFCNCTFMCFRPLFVTSGAFSHFESDWSNSWWLAGCYRAPFQTFFFISHSPFFYPLTYYPTYSHTCLPLFPLLCSIHPPSWFYYLCFAHTFVHLSFYSSPFTTTQQDTSMRARPLDCYIMSGPTRWPPSRSMRWHVDDESREVGTD